MGTFLDTVIAEVEADLSEAKRATPVSELEQRLGPLPDGRPFSEALVAEGVSLIAEMKRASPSRGEIRSEASVEEIVTAYERAGARACSVLTEHRYFGGSLDDLVAARAAVTIPLLRKDFIVDPYQLLEARVAGADAALLIVAGLGRERLAELMAAAAELGLDALVETHDEEEVEIAVAAGAEVIGINNRDLHTLEVDLSTTFRLLADVPAGTVVVAESGITSHEDIRRLQDAGVDAVLVGEALMDAEDTGAAVSALMTGGG
jgi:indole-3-glycerol phosphate synthase